MLHSYIMNTRTTTALGALLLSLAVIVSIITAIISPNARGDSCLVAFSAGCALILLDASGLLSRTGTV